MPDTLFALAAGFCALFALALTVIARIDHSAARWPLSPD